MRAQRSLIAFAVLYLAAAASPTHAQPANVRAWYAQGQVFVVWELLAAPGPTDTVEIYASPAAQITVANMTRVGRLFFPEYTGARLQELQPNARLLLPTPAGGTYRLLANEGAFAYTPHAAGNLFFAVVDTGSVVVNAGNSASTLFNYDPVNEPIRPHPQFNGTTQGGNPYTAYVIWADGRADPADARPDFPVIANEAKNGVPHAFTITRPTGPLPSDPLSCLFAIHGGEGEYQLFRPGVPSRVNLSLGLDDGIVVTPDDSIYFNQTGQLVRTNTSWFGYVASFDPFTNLLRPAPANNEVVVSYTQRRVHWILDWLLSGASPFVVDPERVGMIGHSGGGRGTSHMTRVRPERFAGVVIYTPASDLTIDDGGRDNPLRGNWDQNLATDLIGPAGVALATQDVFTMTTRLSPTERDFAFTRFYYGKRDEEGSAAWSTNQRIVLDSLNDSRAGFMISWDEREHGVEKWDDETSDATDPHPGPWPDIGQWIAPQRTLRPAARVILDTCRASQSYPGQFNADADLVTPLRQPDPGPGDPDLGDAYGTWGGYLEWETDTLVDEPAEWGATLYLTSLSTVPVDNSPFAEIRMDIAPRKTQQFEPAGGSLWCWTLTSISSGDVLQCGTATAEADGVVVATGVIVPTDPDRVRLTFAVCSAQGDMNCDGVISVGDIGGFVLALTNPAAYATQYPDCDVMRADLNNDGLVTVGDIGAFVTLLTAGGC